MILLSSSIPRSNISSWDRCLIDCAINLILWTSLCASCHWWATKVEQPFITGYGQLHLRSVWSWWKPQCVLSSLRVTAEEWGGSSLDRLRGFLANAGRAQGWAVRQTGFGSLRRSSLLQNAPQLMSWDTTVTTWPSKAPLNSPAVLPCVTYGSKCQTT